MLLRSSILCSLVVCGEIMTMPGLPRVPSAEAIGLDENKEIKGLF